MFFTFRTQIVFAYVKECHFCKISLFLFTTTPKTLFFWASFKIFVFHCFHIFFQHKKDKNKKCTFFSKPFFDNLTNCPKIFSRPYTLFVFFEIPKKHYKIGENKQNNLGPSFDATLDQVLTQKNPNLGPSFDSTAHMYMYMLLCSKMGCFFSFYAFDNATVYAFNNGVR